MDVRMLAIAIFLLLGILSSKISSFLKIPTLLLFLGIGMLAGSDGIGGIDFEDYAGANYLGTMALAFILFSGGYDTRWHDIRSVLLPGAALASAGVFLTAVLLGIFSAWFLNVSWYWGLLLGSVISSTDAAAVFAIFRSRNFGLKGRLRPLLEFESGSNDPMAAFLTLFFIELIKHPEGSLLIIFPVFFVKMSIGIALGALVARAMVWLFDHLCREYEGLYYVLGIATVFLAYSLTQLFWGNGFMAVYVCGLVMGNSQFVYKHGLARFNDGLAWLMQVAVFLVLGLLVSPVNLYHIAFEGFVIAMVLMFVVRPLIVWLCMFYTSFNMRELAIVAWGGFRGAAPIVLATFPAIAGFTNPTDVQQAMRLFDIVFFVVVLSIFIQGKSLMPLAHRLQLSKADKLRLRSPLEFEVTGNSNDQLYEFEIGPLSAIIGQTLAELKLPKGALILLIRRKNGFVVPNGRTAIERDDDLLVFFDPIALPQVEAVLTAKGTPDEE
ncbi:MAG: potassium/proton antiporter [Thermoguttaceae bacterium]|nr:potassium/proton antiporter [Thermoguttaceae bacterium]